MRRFHSASDRSAFTATGTSRIPMPSGIRAAAIQIAMNSAIDTGHRASSRRHRPRARTLNPMPDPREVGALRWVFMSSP